MGRRWVAVVAVVYAVLYLILTYPLLLAPATSLPGVPGDGPMFVWNLWQQARAVVEGGQPLETSLVCYPGTLSLATHTHVLLHGLVALPLTLTVGPVVTANLVLLFAFVASGCGAAWLGATLTASRRAGFVAGLVFAFAPYKMVHLLCHHNAVATETVMPFLLALLYGVRKVRCAGGCSVGGSAVKAARSWSLAAGFVLLATLFLDYYLFFYLALAGVVVGVVEIFSRRRGTTLMARCALLVYVPSIVASLLLYWHAVAHGAGQEAALTNVVYTGARHYVADIVSWVLPSFLHPVWGEWAGQLGEGLSLTGHAGEWTVGPGMVTLGLACTAGLLLRRCRYVPHLFALLATGVVLSLGSHPHLLGRPLPITAPYALINVLPFLRNFRTPARAAVLALAALSLLAAYGYRFLERRVNRRVLFPLVVLLVMFEFLTVPFPNLPMSVPPAIRAVSAMGAGGTLLEVPVGLLDGMHQLGILESRQQYYQTIHGCRLLGGTISRLPSRVLHRARTEPFLERLFALQRRERLDPMDEGERRQCRAFLREADVRCVVVHQAFRSPELLAFLGEVLALEPWREYPPGDVVAPVVEVSAYPP